MSDNNGLIIYWRRGDKNSPFTYFTDYLENEYGFKGVQLFSEIKTHWDSDPDIILIPYGMGRLEFLEAKIKLIAANPRAKLILFENEYSLSMVSGLKKYLKESGRKITLLINYEREKCYKYKALADEQFIMNMNCLSYWPTKYPLSDKRYDCVYYGGFRLNRQIYFKRYLKKDVWLSTSKKNAYKFKQICPDLKWITPRFSLRTGYPGLAKFRYSLYIEDPYTHTHYNYPANRFYESLANNCVLLFDVNCRNTFKRYGIDIDSFTVDGYEDLISFIKRDDFENSLQIQKNWLENIRADKKQLDIDLKKMFSKYKKIQ